MEAETNLLFGFIALHLRYIDQEQFAEACDRYPQTEQASFAEFVMENGWITESERSDIDSLLNERLQEHDGDVRKALTSVSVSNPGTADDHDAFTRTIQHVQPAEPDEEPKDVIDERQLEKKELVDKETVDYATSLHGRYTLTRVEGKGGLGQVWLAHDQQLKREVALKEILPDKGITEEVTARLVKEAQITGQLEHPNIIPVYELATDADKTYYTMPFLRGDTLLTRIAKYRKSREEGNADPIEYRQLLQAFVGICHALAYAHSRGVIHRDLKPANVMIGDFGEVIVLDWGLAGLTDHVEEDVDMRQIEVETASALMQTRDGAVMGTPSFMSPEQADGRRSLMGPLTDVYGLGAILFSIITGRSPHKADSLKETRELLSRISSGPTPEAREIAPWVPKPLNAICLQAMAKNRSDRYQSATELANDVERWLGDEPVTVYADPWRDRALRWMRRHKAMTQAIVASLLVVAVSASIVTVFVNEARKTEAAAKVQVTESLEKEKEARAAEKKARDEAIAHFRRSREAVDKSLKGTSDLLTYFPGVQSIRTEILEEAAKDYERFASEKSDDAEIRAESCRAWIRLGDVRRSLNQIQRAEDSYAEAIKALESLAMDSRDHAEYCHFEIANVHSRIANTTFDNNLT